MREDAVSAQLAIVTHTATANGHLPENMVINRNLKLNRIHSVIHIWKNIIPLNIAPSVSNG